jgi:hypothetical protein
MRLSSERFASALKMLGKSFLLVSTLAYRHGEMSTSGLKKQGNACQ